MRNIISLLLIIALHSACGTMAQDHKIDRKKVVMRNNPLITSIDTMASLTVGNGGFAFTVDATGLQSFPEAYKNGVSLGTMSDWGWHSFPNPDSLSFAETLTDYDFGRRYKEPYSVQIKDNERKRKACKWFRENPHRLHLGTIGLELGNDPYALKDINETLNMWNGRIDSRFTYRGNRYKVSTVCHPAHDMIASRIESKGEITVKIKFPYPTGAHSDDACDWSANGLHTTEITDRGNRYAILRHTLDSTSYYTIIEWEDDAAIEKYSDNYFVIRASGNRLRLTCCFSEDDKLTKLTFDETAATAAANQADFWQCGGMVDFAECKDKRAAELERRVITSLYLLAAQEAGDTPPQETGLTYNSWFGKFHLEMTLWHLAQFPLWGHPELLDRQLKWYNKAAEQAKNIAQRQGFDGLRWMKMTDPDGIESPSDIGSFLIWQQPHLIYLAELLYRSTNNDEILSYYGKIVDETAEFMASFAEYDSTRHRYILRGCIAAQETLRPETTINPPLELAYWQFGLNTAQKWRERRGMKRVALWDDIISRISPLASHDSLYLAAESRPDTYSDEHLYSDHPAVLGAAALVPYNKRMYDTAIMKNTERWIFDNWKWDTSWGWDFPMMAMCSTRTGEPARAVDALMMNERTNTYLPNGHNYQDGRLRVYMPGNGGLLMAVALMCAGWDGCGISNPGFPDDGNWNVKWEGILPMP